MLRSILVLVVLSLGTSNAAAQTPSHKTSQTANNSFDCANAKKCYERGLELTESGQFMQAVESFRQAVQFDPEYADAYAALGRTYFKLRDWQKAIDNLNRAAGINHKQREASEAILKKRETEAQPTSLKQNTAAIIEVKKPLPQAPVPPAVKLNYGTSLSNKEPGPQTVVFTKPAVNEVARLPSPPEQTAFGDRVAMIVAPPPRTEPISLTKIYRVGPSDVLDVRLNTSGQESTAAKVTVVRNESNEIHEIDLSQAAEMNFLVRAGDVITLSPNKTQFIYIGGEIKFPGEKTFRRGLTLMQAMLAAGGPGTKAKVAEIARDDGNGFLIPTRYKLKEIISGKAVDPLLKPGDRISILR